MTNYAKYKGRYETSNEMCRQDKDIREGRNLPNILRRCLSCDCPFTHPVNRKCKKCKEQEREAGFYDGTSFDMV